MFYLFYWLLFSQDTFFVIRRFCYGQYWVYHLFILWLYFHSKKNKRWLFSKRLFNTPPNLLPEVSVFPEGHQVSVGVWDILRFCYWGIVTLLLGRIVIQLVSIVQLVYKGKRACCCSTSVITLSGKITPFSFFKWIFVSPSLYNSDDMQEINHSRADSCGTVSFVGRDGFRNFMCFLLDESRHVVTETRDRRNLEFLADKCVVHSGFDRKAYQYHLLRLSHPSAAAQIVNKFNVSPLKKRIMMMNKKEPPEWG